MTLLLRRRWLTTTLILLALNLVLVFLVSDNRSLVTDLAIAREVQQPRGLEAILLPLMVLVSEPGYLPWRVLLFVIACGVPLLAGLWRIALLINLSLIGDVTSSVLKAIVARPRPTAEQLSVYTENTNASFPSGHVLQYVVFFGVLAYVAWGIMRHHPGRPVRIGAGLVFWTSIALIALVGVSRIYLGAHWPTDVIGGYLIGAGWLIALIAVDQRVLRVHQREARLRV